MKIGPGGLLGIGVAALASVAIVLTLSFGGGDRMCRGVTVSGVSVGGLTKAEAADAIRSWAERRATTRITLTALDTRWSGTLADFGARVEWCKALDRAFDLGRGGNVFRRMVCVLTPVGSGKRIRVGITADDAAVERTIGEIAASINRPHRDARIRIVDGRLEVRQDSWGIRLDAKKAASVVSRALVGNRLVVPLPIEPDKPEVTSEDAAGIDTLLARFTTSFNPQRRDRTHNLELAAGTIDGVILKPGQEFSYNAFVGPRLLDRGYREAPIFIKGKLEPGVGGGVCQVSSTLYNSALFAGLNIIERHPHSRTVPYVHAGRDATVAYGLQDFRFENSNPSSVAVLTNVTGSRLTVDIYGAAEDKKKIEIFTSRAKHVAAGTKTVIDKSLAPGQKKVLDKGADGISVIVYRKVAAPDGSVTTEVVSRDRYPAQKTIIAVGPSAAPPRPAVTDIPVSLDSQSDR